MLNGGVIYGAAGEYRDDASMDRGETAGEYRNAVGGKIEFTGGEIVADGLSINLDNEGGKLVVGLSDSTASVFTASASGITYRQRAAGGLQLDVFSKTSFDKVNYTDSTIIFDDGTKLYIFVDPSSGLITGDELDNIVTAGTITGDGSTFEIYVNGILSDWQAEIAADGKNMKLVVGTIIPEPALSAALLGLLGLAMAGRRRRK